MTDWAELIPSDGEWSFSRIRRSDVRTGPSERQEADADGGRPVSGRPYFYSAGADGDPSTLDDNLYNVRPEFRSKRN